MDCLGFDTGDAFFWVFLSAFFFGAAISRASSIPSRKRNPERDRNVKWSFFSIYLSISILLALAGLFIAGSEEILTIRLLFFFGGVTGVSFFAVRFKKSIGLSLIIVVIVLFFSLPVILQPWTCFNMKQKKIMEFRVLSIKDDIIKLELLFEEESSEVIDLGSSALSVIAGELVFSEHFIFFRKKRLYRLEGFRAYSIEEKDGEKVYARKESADYYLSLVGLQGQIIKLLIEKSSLIPGIAYTRMETKPFRPIVIQKYAITIPEEGELKVEPVYP